MKNSNAVKTIGALALVLAMAVNLAVGAAANPKVLPPDSSPYGKSYGEWSAAWWTWTFSLPVTGHPLFDGTGLNSDPLLGQSGPVVFLGGMFTLFTDQFGTRTIGQADRSITIPVGKALFFPIVNTEANNWSMPPDPPTTLTVDELRELASWILGHAANLTCTIDGQVVQGLTDAANSPYRVQSPPFYYTLPEQDNLWQYWGVDVTGQNPPPGDVNDGIYLMVAPLSVGEHVIHFSGDNDLPEWDSYFSLDITYHITVSPK